MKRHETKEGTRGGRQCSEADEGGLHMLLCTSCLRLQDTVVHDKEYEDACAVNNEEDCLSSSSTSSIADTVANMQRMCIQVEPGGVFYGASAGDDDAYHLHINHHDMQTGHDSDTARDGEFYSTAHHAAHVWLLPQTPDCHDYRRFEIVDLELPASVTAGGGVSHGAFWAKTASNLERLGSLGLIGHCSLVARGVHVEEVEMEVDATALRLWANVWHESDVRMLRVCADIDTMRAHALDCVHCAEPGSFDCSLIVARGRGNCGWESWWGNAMCLSDHLSFLSRYSQDISGGGGHVHGGCDLDFLGASACS